MLYKTLAEVYEKVSSTTKRLEKIAILSEFFRNIQKKDREVLYLLLGNIYASYDERKIGISHQLVIKAISKTLGISKERVVDEWKKLGDLGVVIEKLIKNKKQSTLQSSVLTVDKVINNLRKLPELEGKGTIDKKISLIVELLNSASPLEAKYLIRTLIGDLRIGIQESTIRDALAKAFFKNSKEASEKIQKAIDSSNDIAKVFEISQKKDLNALEEVEIQVGNPIKVMLAQKISSLEKGFEALGKPCAIEYKYDGFRLIIHKKQSKEIILFTRRLENVTKQFPEVVNYVKKYIKGKSFIIDSEAVGYDPETKKYKPFQAISQRIRRKYNIQKLMKELPVEVNAFDILYYNGKSLIDKKFLERTKLLRKVILPAEYKIVCSKQIITSDIKEAEKFYKKALDDNQEGVIMKNLNAEYKPGRRVGHMLKLKPEERDLDLVITGAEYGTGKRSGWLTSFILSCKHKNKFLEVGKVSTGLKEKSSEESRGISFKELTEKLKPYITEEEGKKVKIKPKIVVSVTYQEVQISPNYNSGIALRFPRFTALREDKPLSEINTLDDIKKELKKQR